MALKTSFEFSLLQMLTTLWSSLKHVNNYYNSHKVSNYKSFHKEKILAINASRLLWRYKDAYWAWSSLKLRSGYEHLLVIPIAWTLAN